MSRAANAQRHSRLADSSGPTHRSHHHHHDRNDRNHRQSQQPEYDIPENPRSDRQAENDRTPRPLAVSTPQGDNEDDEEEREEEEEEGVGEGSMTSVDSSHVAVELQQGLLVMYRNHRLTDVSIKVGRAVYRCHRVVLCAMSPLFTRLLTEDSDRRLIIFKNADPAVFEDVLEYIYTGRLSISDKFEEFLNLILKLEISSLAGKMGGFLSRHLSRDNCLTIWRYAANNPDLSELSGNAEQLMVEQFFHEDVTAQLQHLTLPELTHVLDHEGLQAENEEMVVKRALQWLKAREVRGAEASELFQRLCLPLTSKEFIRREVEVLGIVSEDPKCRELVTEAMTFLSHPERRHEFHSKSITYRKSNPNAEVMVVFGGYKLNGGRAKDCVALDLGGQDWYILSPFPHHPGKGMATCVYDNYIYVSGGSSDPQAFWIYISKDNRWMQGPPLANGRRHHSMEVAEGGTICVMGGTVEVEVSREEDDEEEEGGREEGPPQFEEEVVVEVETLGVGKEEWREVMELLLPVSEAASSVTSDGSKIFLYGGKLSDGRPTDSVQCLDLKARTCTLLSTGLPLACAGAVGARTFATYFLLSTKGEVMRFDPETAQLLSVDKVPHFKRRRFRLVCHHDKLLVIGGEDGSDVLRYVVCLYLDESSVQLVPWENFQPPVRAHFGLAKVVVPRHHLGEPQW